MVLAVPKASMGFSTREEETLKYYAACGILTSPHAIDPSTGTYMTWVGPERNTYGEANTDAKNHNKNAGHTAIVLQHT